jgi:hypothetical protein
MKHTFVDCVKVLAYTKSMLGRDEDRRRVMRVLILGMLAVVVSIVEAQTFNPRETITVGIDLSLGMTEDAVVKNLAASGYKVRKMEPPSRLKKDGITSMWIVDDRGDQKSTPTSLGVILFSSGRLSTAMRELLPDDSGSQVEFGRQLYFAMRDLEAEGNSQCTIQTVTEEVPEFAHKTARLRCGEKTIVIDLQKQQNKNETVQLAEEVGHHLERDARY